MRNFLSALLVCALALAGTDAAAREVVGMREFAACTETGLPVRVSGTVRMRIPWNAALNVDLFVVSNPDGNAVVRIDSDNPARIGDVVDVRGITFYKDQVGLIVDEASAVTTDHVPLPPTVDADLKSVSQGKFNYRTVRVSGQMLDVVKDEIDPGWNWMLLESNGMIGVVACREDVLSIDRLKTMIDATVSAEGLCLPVLYGGRQFLGPHIELETPDSLKVVHAPEDGRFDAPPLGLIPGTPPPFRRHRSDGRVIARWRGNRLFLLTGDGDRMQVHLRNGAVPPDLDAHVRVIGYPETDIFYRKLVMAECRPADGEPPALSGPQDISPARILKDNSGADKIKPGFNGQFIRIRGKVKGLAADGNFVLESDGFSVPVETSMSRGLDRPPEENSSVEVAGVCLMEFENERPATGFPRLKGFSLVLRDSADIAVLARPPWWTPGKFLVVIGVLLLLLLAILGWNVSLRIVAERRGRELFRENVARVTADLRTDERTRLAIDLHDSLAQNLTGVSLQIAAGNMELASKALKSCREELRNCLWDLRNQALDAPDLNAAIRTTVAPHIGSASLAVRFNVPRTSVSDPTAHALLGIIRELATNAVRHGHAQTIRIAGGIDEDVLRFSVRDDGCGFDPKAALGMSAGHFGLQGIRERVRRLNGTVEIESAPDAGTKVIIALKRQT